MATKKKTEPVEIQIPQVTIKNLEITLVGDSPLLMHRWSDKAKKQMLDKQMKKAKKGKEAKDPAMDFAQSIYLIDEKEGDRQRMRDGDFKGIRFGFPTIAFKGSAVSACRFSDGVKMTEARGAFHINGDMTEIITPEPPRLREDMVRISMGTADIRYRAEFPVWKARLIVRYNTSALSVEQIVNLFNTGGFGVGVGEWRPEKNGSMGMFHVQTGDE